MSFVSKFCKYSFLAVLYIVLLLVGAYVTWFLFPFHLIVDYSKLDQRTTPSLVDIEVNKILTHEYVTTAPNITLHVNLAGDPKGEPIFFIHGFPESGTLTWKHQIVYFAKKGYFVIAPDLRGYNTSSKPVGVEHYMRSKLTRDILKLVEHYAGNKPVKMVAHDWGGLLMWQFLAEFPEHVERAAILNLPHPKALVYDRPLIQFVNSYYIYLFQTPYWLLKHQVEPEGSWLTYFALGSFTNKTSIYDINEIRSKWQIPGELESTINWYKAVLIKDKPDTRDFTTTSPVKVIWGNQDIFLDVSLGRASLKYVDNEHKKFVEINGTHWISREMPEVVNKELDEWFNEKF